jgi:hypothetical protein
VLYQLSYLGTVHGKKSEALLQDRPRKIKLPGISGSFGLFRLFRWFGSTK